MAGLRPVVEIYMVDFLGVCMDALLNHAAKLETFMRARIFQPAKTAMSSGTAKTKHWVLEFAPASARSVDPLMGWTSSADTQTQVQLTFESKDEALEYARDRGIEVQVQEPTKRKANIRPGGYGENFATNRRGAWTH